MTQSADLVGGKSAVARRKLHKYNVYPGKPAGCKTEPMPEEIEELSTDQ